MSESRELLERVGDRYPFPDDAFERMLRRRDRKRRNQRVAAGAVGIALAVAAIVIGTSVVRSSPADREPVAPPSMRNGPIEVFGFTGGVREYGGHGLGPFVVRCSGSCTAVRGASWSPDGRLLAFGTSCAGACASVNDAYHGLRIADPVTGTDRLLVPGEWIGSISWSPDGARIAYSQDGALYVVDANGSNRTQLVPSYGSEWLPVAPSWSPDGTRLAYSAVSAESQVWVASLDGSGPVLVANGSAPAWSPDGRTIAYLVGCQIREVTPEGSEDRLLVDLSMVRLDARTCDGSVDLKWSPDGSELAALVTGHWRTGHVSSSDGLFIVQAEDGAARLLGGWTRTHFFGITWQPIP